MAHRQLDLSPRQQGALISLFGLLFFAAGLTILLTQTLPPLLRYAGATAWPTVPATVVESRVENEYRSHAAAGGGSIVYETKLRYRYAVDGGEYEGDVFRPMDIVYHHDDYARNSAAKYAKGTTFDLHVKPGDPATSIVDPNLGPFKFLYVCFPTAVGLLGLFFVLLGVRRFRHPETAAREENDPREKRRGESIGYAGAAAFLLVVSVGFAIALFAVHPMEEIRACGPLALLYDAAGLGVLFLGGCAFLALAARALRRFRATPAAEEEPTAPRTAPRNDDGAGARTRTADLLLDPAERLRVDARLEPGESIVWLGRPVPAMRARDKLGWTLLGLAVCLLVGLFLWQVVLPAWTGAGGEMRFNGETATEWARKGLGAKLGLTIFALPFAALAVGLLGAPLWWRILEARRIYLVTDRRAHRIGRFLSKAWSPAEMTELGRADAFGGLVDVYFATTREYGRDVGPGGRIVPDGFLRLWPDDADAAERALLPLAPAAPSPEEEPHEEDAEAEQTAPRTAPSDNVAAP